MCPTFSPTIFQLNSIWKHTKLGQNNLFAQLNAKYNHDTKSNLSIPNAGVSVTISSPLVAVVVSCNYRLHIDTILSAFDGF